MVTAASPASQEQQTTTVEAEDFDLPSDYQPYVPVAKRRAQLRSALTGKHHAKKAKVSLEELHKERIVDLEEDDEEEREREKLRKERTLLQAAQEVKERRAAEGESLRTYQDSGRPS